MKIHLAKKGSYVDQFYCWGIACFSSDYTTGKIAMTTKKKDVTCIRCIKIIKAEAAEARRYRSSLSDDESRWWDD